MSGLTTERRDAGLSGALPLVPVAGRAAIAPVAGREEIADALVADLFSNGSEQATILQLRDARGQYLGGLSRLAARENILVILRSLGVALLLLMFAWPAAADEPTPFAWPAEQRPIAKAVADAAVTLAIALDTVHSLRADDRGEAFIDQGCRLGVAVGATVLVKNLVHRDRPDHSNRFSFPSGHTANSMASAGWRYSIGVPISLGAAFGRMGAYKHYPTDIVGGALIGLGADWFCGRVL
jgi:membrane-associated phospholipid phosphatase